MRVSSANLLERVDLPPPVFPKTATFFTCPFASCRTTCRSAANAKVAFERTTAARSRGRSPRRRGASPPPSGATTEPRGSVVIHVPILAKLVRETRSEPLSDGVLRLGDAASGELAVENHRCEHLALREQGVDPSPLCVGQPWHGRSRASV